MAGNIDLCVAWRRGCCQPGVNTQWRACQYYPASAPAPCTHLAPHRHDWQGSRRPPQSHGCDHEDLRYIPTGADFSDRNNPRSCLAPVHPGRAHPGVEEDSGSVNTLSRFTGTDIVARNVCVGRQHIRRHTTQGLGYHVQRGIGQQGSINLLTE